MEVFPTPVGVFLDGATTNGPLVSLPHARGGVSLEPEERRVSGGSSPRPWGCFYLSLCGCVSREVFPTPVGVFPPEVSAFSNNSGLPHARGGVSE